MLTCFVFFNFPTRSTSSLSIKCSSMTQYSAPTNRCLERVIPVTLYFFCIPVSPCVFCVIINRCSRKHHHPVSATTLMIRNMFVTFGMEQLRRDDYDTDASLEYSEEEIQQQFLEFYHDVLAEFRNAGKVVQFKVSKRTERFLN